MSHKGKIRQRSIHQQDTDDTPPELETPETERNLVSART